MTRDEEFKIGFGEFMLPPIWILEAFMLLIVALDPLVTLPIWGWILGIVFAVVGPPMFIIGAMDFNGGEHSFGWLFSVLLFIVGLVLTAVVLLLPYIAARLF